MWLRPVLSRDVARRCRGRPHSFASSTLGIVQIPLIKCLGTSATSIVETRRSHKLENEARYRRLFSTINQPKFTPDEDEAAKERQAAEDRYKTYEKTEDLLQNRALLPKKLSWNAVARALVGNSIITALKFGVYMQTGSSAMLSEAVHTLADSGNQILLLKGLQEASRTPDKRYQYGYGKASFFWALVSALGMFWTGAGISFGHGLYTLVHPPEMFEVSREMLGVLAASFLVDGFVLAKTVREVASICPPNVSQVTHFMSLRDPFVLAVLFEDAAACTGVACAGLGIYLSKVNNDVGYDTLAGITVGCLLAGVAVKLVQINNQFLMGQAVDEDIVSDIRSILRGRPGINAVYDIQSQWVGPSAFAFKAECDFNGYILAKKLQDLYTPLFLEVAQKKVSEEDKRQELGMVMSWMAEDVTRLIEQEVKEVETIIRTRHPMAAFIELEPDSKKTFLRAYDGKAWKEVDATLKTELGVPRLLNLDREMSLPLTQKLITDEQIKREAAKVITDMLQRRLSDISPPHTSSAPDSPKQTELSKHR